MGYQSVQTLTPEDILAHHGIKNQRWGFRRFQNPDGSLTEAGKRRYRKLSDKEERIQSKKKELVGDKQPDIPKNPHGKKSVFSMSDSELNSEIERLGLEKKYKDLMKDLYHVNSERYFNGRKVVGEMMTRGLTAAGINVVENVTGHQLNKLGKALGLDYNLYTKQQQKKKDN